jgi:DNA-binding beta-propeller fold protein YncE
MLRDPPIVRLGTQLYRIERPFGRVPLGHSLHEVSQVAVDSAGRVLVFRRADPPVLVFSPAGDLLHEWGAGRFHDPHGIAVTPDDRVLLVDRDAHFVSVCTVEGEELLRLGTAHRPRDGAPFNHPSDAAVDAGGRIWVADGYGNARLHVFDREGRHLESFGAPGHGPGEFGTPHGIWVDRQGRVLVADRENHRVQVLDAQGRFLAEWRDLYKPMDIWEDAEGGILVTDQISRLSRFTPDGGLAGRCRAAIIYAHGVWGDAAGAIYLAELPPIDRIAKLVPIADPG